MDMQVAFSLFVGIISVAAIAGPIIWIFLLTWSKQ